MSGFSSRQWLHDAGVPNLLGVEHFVFLTFAFVVARRGRAEDDGPLEDGEHRANADDKKKEKKEKKEKEKKQPVTDGTDHPDPEIAEANRLRAALGLKPLRP